MATPGFKPAKIIQAFAPMAGGKDAGKESSWLVAAYSGGSDKKAEIGN